MVNVENENTFLKACSTGLNLFAGSGFSLYGKNAAGANMPTGEQLRQELVSAFGLTSIDGLSLPQVCTIIASERRAELYSFLTRRFFVSSFDPRYSIIESLSLSAVFTTNIDNLFFQIYKDSTLWFLNDIAIRGPALSGRSAVDFIALHGCILHEGEELTFGSSELAASFPSDPDKWHLFTGMLQKFPTLFWGYRLADAGTLQALNPSTTKGRSHQDKWIVLSEPTEADIKYFRALGFQIIQADTLSLLDYLSQSIPERGQSVPPGRSTSQVFPEFAIPTAGSLPVRPILDFFLGNPPTWPDIHSGRIPRTHHFATIHNLINAGSSLIAIGVPACGKTTLMMQLAYHVQFAGHKLVCNSLTEDNANLLIRRLGSERALVFVDDCADSIEAFNALLDAPNVVAIGFERDLPYETVSHRVSKSKVRIHDISALNSKDIQEIFSVLPVRIRRQTYEPPEMGDSTDPAVFEVIENNILEAVIKFG